jgi:hypothetical protein
VLLDLLGLCAHFSNGSFQAFLDRMKILSCHEFIRKVAENQGKKVVDQENIFQSQISQYWIFEIISGFVQWEI